MTGRGQGSFQGLPTADGPGSRAGPCPGLVIVPGPARFDVAWGRWKVTRQPFGLGMHVKIIRAVVRAAATWGRTSWTEHPGS